MVAPNTGNESVSYLIKIDVIEAKKALEDIVKSEADVATKTEQLKNLMISLAVSLNQSLETTAKGFKKWDAIFGGTTKSIIDNAAKLAKVQLLGDVSPVQAEQLRAIQDAQDKLAASADVRIANSQRAQAEEQKDAELQRKNAQAIAEARVSAALVSQEAERKRSEEAQKDANLEYQRAKSAAEARVNSALEVQVANEKIAQSIRNIINANTSTEVKVQQLKQIILDMARTSGKSIEQVVAEIKKMDTAFAGTSNTVVNLAGNAARLQLFPQANQGATGFLATLNQIGIVGQAALGITLVGALRSVIDYFGQATKAALEFSQTQIELQIGARATQRMGNDTTIQEYYKEIAAIQEKYPIFSRQEATEAYSNALLLGRGLKLTTEQFEQLIDISASAAIVMGRDFGDTALGITKSLSSGWFEAAQRAGFLISRQSVVDEGLKMNIENAKHGYNAMTEYERAYAALSRYVKENGSVQQDVNVVMESQAGKVKIAGAEWSNLKLAVGQFFTTLTAGTGILDYIIYQLQGWAEAFESIRWTVSWMKGLVTTFKEFLDLVFVRRHEGVPFLEDLKKAIYDLQHFDFGDELNKNVEDEIRKAELVPLLGNAGEDAGAALGEGLEEGLDGADFADAFEKLGYDIEDELIRMANRMEQLWTDLMRKLADINEDEFRALEKENADYAQSVERENISYAQRVADVNAKYRLNEINAEARYHEQLRQLRQRFLFDLEDALRDRDARQVLRLSAQYQMDKTNAKKEYELEQEERARAHQLELAQIAAQHAERLRVLAEEHAAEIAAIHEKAEIQRAEAQLRYQQELDDLKAQTDARLEQKLRDFMREYNLTEAQAKNLVRMLDKYFGKNGQVAQMYTNLAAHILAMIRLIQESLNSLAGIGGGPTPLPRGDNPHQPVSGGGYAKGGSFLATKPTRILVGEGGEAEFVSITPMSRIRRGVEGNMAQVPNNVASSRQSAMPGGALQIRLGLSAGLEAQIIDDTLYEVTAIVEEINRVR